LKRLGALAFALFACACAAAESAPASGPVATAAVPVATTPARPAVPPPPATLTLNCAGALVQGGIVLCRTLPGATIEVDGEVKGAADGEGWAVIGFDRFAEGARTITARANDATVSEILAIAPREFGEQRVDGLPQQTVTPTDPAVLARIARERDVKNVGFASRAPAEGWLDGFVLPTEGRVSSSWGNRRILNGVPNTPHYGVDIAAPDGTAIRAPAGGVVSLAEADMHYEGGLVFIDHGQGLISMYLHMSRLDVKAGDQVAQGQVIGAVGHAGRATGPHLCWRLKWRDQNLDPSVALTALSEARTQLSAP
jgi:murein DD-endopeptidase MepM/ murein hydrolase activator NlpD